MSARPDPRMADSAPVVSPELSPGSYLEPGDPSIPAEIPDGWVAWVEDGVVRMEEDEGGSPGSWPIEEM